jgi:dipeptidyl aminopeptidase/acylaminoacyl peptidase
MMKNILCSIVLIALALAAARAQVPDNLVVEGIPSLPLELRKEAGPYLEFRAARFNSWHPVRREMLISTRFADTVQLHLVKTPGGARRQLTFFNEPVAGGSFRPRSGECIVFAQDAGGGEFYQLYRLDLAEGRITLLTDGQSRNSGPRWSRSGKWFAYTSTRRTGRDNDIYVMDAGEPRSDRRLIEVSGGGWRVLDWSADESRLLLLEYISINESYLHLADAKTGAMELLTPKTGDKVSWTGGQFAKDSQSLFVTTDKESEFQRLCRMDLATKQLTPLTANIRGDVESFELSPDGRMIAFVSNEDGVSVLHLLDARSGRERRAPKLPLGVIGGLEWHENSRDLAFTMSSAQSPNDVYSFDVRTGRVERWTESETGGLNPESFVEPELVKLKSFDGLGISAFVYRPDPKKFPGPRPVLINIHGGPESQSRPAFQARNNYYLNELGLALVYPNVRGSDGYGKTFLTLDNGLRRESAVRDIGAIIGWIRQDPRLDGARIGVIGGSYGGYMVLASMIHFNDQLRCGVDVVGISNFLTFLKNTQDYRRDLRRAEYGDERDEKTRVFLERISPTANVKKITKPMFIVQGKNDPRVPLSESEQMVQALRNNGVSVWYLMAKDEGHGFQKKRNADFQFLSTILFLREQLLK